MIVRRRWRFVGRVQGIGFRAFCEESALARGVRGWVRNETDGSVAMEAEGPPDELGELCRHLKAGHPFARVDRLEERSTAVRGDPGEGFNIR